MTATPLEPSTTGEGADPRVVHLAVACAFCRRRLGGEYYFTCRRCEASYCYIHMSRHRPALCERREARRRNAPTQVKREGELLLAGAGPTRTSSATV